MNTNLNAYNDPMAMLMKLLTPVNPVAMSGMKFSESETGPISTETIPEIPGSGEYNLLLEALKTLKYGADKQTADEVKGFYPDRLLIDPGLSPIDKAETDRKIFNKHKQKIRLNPMLFGEYSNNGYYLQKMANNPVFKDRYKEKEKILQNNNLSKRVMLAGILNHELFHTREKWATNEDKAYNHELDFYQNIIKNLKQDKSGDWKIPVIENIMNSRRKDYEEQNFLPPFIRNILRRNKH